MTMTFEIDQSAWPVCLVEVGGTMTAKEFDFYLSTFLEDLHKDGKRAYIFDMSRGWAPNSIQRKAQAKFFREKEDLLVDRVLGSAVVAPNAIARGVITAINWIQRYPVPVKVFSNRDDAAKQCMKWCRRAGVPLHPSKTILAM